MTVEEASKRLSDAHVRAGIAAGLHLEEPPYHPLTAEVLRWYPFPFQLRLGKAEGHWSITHDYETRAEAEAAWPKLAAEWPEYPVQDLVEWTGGVETVLEHREPETKDEAPTVAAVGA